MNGIERESTMGQAIVAVQGLAQLLMFFPKMGQKAGALVCFIFSNFKQFAIFLCCALGFLVFLLVAMHYTESEYNIKARLANFLVPSTAVKDF